jgi:hypothetical protein
MLPPVVGAAAAALDDGLSGIHMGGLTIAADRVEDNQIKWAMLTELR